MKSQPIYNIVGRAISKIYNAFAWLTVDSTITVSETYQSGIEFAKLELLYGLYLSNPFFNVFSTTKTFVNIERIAPTHVWGIILMSLSVGVLYGYYREGADIKAAGMLLIGIYWLIAAMAIISANPLATSSIIYPWLAYCNIARAARIKTASKTTRG